jgi:hypothetical protein
MLEYPLGKRICKLLTLIFMFRLLCFSLFIFVSKPLHNMLFPKIENYMYIFFKISKLLRTCFLRLNFNLSFLPTYYHRNELLWQDGFLFDFLQKKSADVWLRKFVINTGYLFSERLVFDQVIRVYLDNLL